LQQGPLFGVSVNPQARFSAVVLLWWHDTPQLHGFGEWLTNASRDCAHVADHLGLRGQCA
jgi:hypothetical protein